MKYAMVAFLLFLHALPLSAQPGERKTEMSLSMSLQNIVSGGGSSNLNILVAPRVGFFVHEGLELEPEFILLAGAGDAAYIFNGNVSYNFIGKSKTVPFLLVGYGISNTVPLFNIMPVTHYDFSVGVLNFGGGIKVFVVENVGLRIEYRFQNFTGEGRTDFGFYTFTNKVDVQMHMLQVGFSVLL